MSEARNQRRRVAREARKASAKPYTKAYSVGGEVVQFLGEFEIYSARCARSSIVVAWSESLRIAALLGINNGVPTSVYEILEQDLAWYHRMVSEVVADRDKLKDRYRQILARPELPPEFDTDMVAAAKLRDALGRALELSRLAPPAVNAVGASGLN